MSITFFVPGIPVPKGSAKAFVVKGRAIVTQTNAAKQKPWASMISVMAQQSGIRPHTGPVLVAMAFYMPRPKHHFNSKGEVKDSVGLYHVVKPDIDKLVRCLFDALTGIAWVDDSQAQITSAMKVYSRTATTQPGVQISINQIGDPV